MKEQMIDGENFMLLTKQTLGESPFKFSVGVILLIEDLIKKLKNQEDADIGNIETSMEKMNIKDNAESSKAYHEFSYKAIADDIKSTNHSISETTIGNFYRGDSELTPGNKLAVQKWVGKFIDEWKKDGRSVTILVKLDLAHNTNNTIDINVAWPSLSKK
ncbi:hypothetical protein RhiirA4_550315 [Rhizophagus irregularis]|uniref:Uncharacterized protein n=1 Tax=Rhizophagus irregularis TaxID=588596 RepID=A0A2I1HK85_9GLOM|nr:hypothetical protein RhiirA4_550315 [Rhizophagus irregularis]